MRAEEILVFGHRRHLFERVGLLTQLLQLVRERLHFGRFAPRTLSFFDETFGVRQIAIDQP